MAIILFDMDISTGHQGFNQADANSFASKIRIDSIRLVAIMNAFLANDDFRNYFINRYADLINTSFSTASLEAEIIRSRDEIFEDIKSHFEKWGKTHDNWRNNEIPKLFKFASERPSFARQYVMEYFGLGSKDQITIQSYPRNAGDIHINSLQITPDQFPWQGIYFYDEKIQLTPVPNDESIFSHWEIQRADGSLEIK